jgi:hypothetical protein
VATRERAKCKELSAKKRAKKRAKSFRPLPFALSSLLFQADDELQLVNIPSFARSVTKDCQYDKHEYGDKDNDDRDLHDNEEKTNQRDQLFKKSDYDKNKSEYSSEPATEF